MTFKEKAEALEDAYHEAIARLAAEAREAHVIPFCNLMDCSFETINGDWWFNSPYGVRVDFWMLPQALQDVLNIPTWPNTCDLGCFMECYYPLPS